MPKDVENNNPNYKEEEVKNQLKTDNIVLGDLEEDDIQKEHLQDFTGGKRMFLDDEEVEEQIKADEAADDVDQLNIAELEREQNRINAEMEELKKKEKALKAYQDEIERKRAKFDTKKEKEVKKDKDGKEIKPEVEEKVGNPELNYIKKAEPDYGVEVDPDIIGKQADDVYRLKHGLRYSTDMRKSSNEFKRMQKDLNKLDEFMKEIKGRTNLSKDEIEMYDKLSLKAYNSSRDYLEMKDKQKEMRDEAGKKTEKSAYEEARIQQGIDVNESIRDLRAQMFKTQTEAKMEEMRKQCEAAIKQEQEAMNKLVGMNIDDKDKQAELEQCVGRTLFFQNRMQDLERQGEFNLKPGESFSSAMNRLDNSIVPSKADIDATIKNPLVKDVVNNTMSQLAEGKEVTPENIADQIKNGAMKKGDELREQKMREKNQRKIDPAAQKENNLELKPQSQMSK